MSNFRGWPIECAASSRAWIIYGNRVPAFDRVPSILHAGISYELGASESQTTTLQDKPWSLKTGFHRGNCSPQILTHVDPSPQIWEHLKRISAEFRSDPSNPQLVAAGICFAEHGFRSNKSLERERTDSAIDHPDPHRLKLLRDEDTDMKCLEVSGDKKNERSDRRNVAY